MLHTWKEYPSHMAACWFWECVRCGSQKHVEAEPDGSSVTSYDLTPGATETTCPEED